MIATTIVKASSGNDARGGAGEQRQAASELEGNDDGGIQRGKRHPQRAEHAGDTGETKHGELLPTVHDEDDAERNAKKKEGSVDRMCAGHGCVSLSTG
jgi:hypothetical protein